MGDVSMDEIKGAADEVLATLKTEELTDAKRKEDIEALLDRMTQETFNDLTILAQ